jgi:hypothetical protein
VPIENVWALTALSQNEKWQEVCNGRNNQIRSVRDQEVHATGQVGLIDFYGDEDYKSNITYFFSKRLAVRDGRISHVHDFDMYLHFLSFDPDDMEHLDADIEIGLGPEQEIHKINSPAVFLFQGNDLCPLTFKRVGKPIFFVHTSIAPKYTKIGDEQQ